MCPRRRQGSLREWAPARTTQDSPRVKDTIGVDTITGGRFPGFR